MARIRTIKPDFWTDDKLVELDFATRLFFIGTWNHADDNGNLRRSAKSLKMKIFPADAIDCEPLIQSLIAHGMLTEYSASGADYLHIRCFSKHQVINRKSKSAIPLPPWLTESGDAAPDARGGDAGAGGGADPNAPPGDRGGDSQNGPPRQHNDSMNGHGLLTEDSLTEKEEEEEKEGSKPKGVNDDVGSLIPGDAVDNSRSSSSLSASEIVETLTAWERVRGKTPRFDLSQPPIAVWALRRLTAAQLRQAYDLAVVARDEANDTTAVNAGFLDGFVAKALAPPKLVKPPLRGMSDPELCAEARRLGFELPAGLDRGSCIARIEQKRTEQRGGPTA